MGARNVHEGPQDGGRSGRWRIGSLLRALRPHRRSRPTARESSGDAPYVSSDDGPSQPVRQTIGGGHPSRLAPSLAAIGVLLAAVAFVAAITYYGARQFTGDAARSRATDEAESLAQHSSRLATGDAFAGYIQILRYADDPVVNDEDAPRAERVAAMRLLLELNDNKFASLAVADLSGHVLASTGAFERSLADSKPFMFTRATDGPANSDVVLEAPGERGYIEFTSPLRDSDGVMWGVLAGRADPARVWSETLLASIDGSRNVIVNTQGQYAAGVPEAQLGTPWHGRPLDDGSVLVAIDGSESICALAPIGRDTRIDQGLSIASCLPLSMIDATQDGAMGNLGLVALAAAAFAVVLGAGVLRALLHRPPAPALAVFEAEPQTERAGEETDVADGAPVVAESEDVEPEEDIAEPDEPQPEEEPEQQSEPEEEPLPVTAADVDALALIEAYEARNARLAERLRESVQARLLIATTRAGEAYRTKSSDPAASTQMHADATEELEDVRERELRSIGQELHPSLVRLGLPAALRSLKKDLASTIDITLDIDPQADAVGETAGRVAIPASLRLVLYRVALESLRALADVGAHECGIGLNRTARWLTLSVAGSGARRSDIDEAALRASRIGIEASGGRLDLTDSEEGVAIIARIASQVAATEADLAVEDGDRPPGPGGIIGLVAALEALRAESDVSVDLRAEPGDRASLLDDDALAALATIARDAVDTITQSGVGACSLLLHESEDQLILEATCECAEPPDLARLPAHEADLGGAGGSVVTTHEDGRLAITASLSLETAQADAEQPASSDAA